MVPESERRYIVLHVQYALPITSTPQMHSYQTGGCLCSASHHLLKSQLSWLPCSEPWSFCLPLSHFLFISQQRRVGTLLPALNLVRRLHKGCDFLSPYDPTLSAVSLTPMAHQVKRSHYCCLDTHKGSESVQNCHGPQHTKKRTMSKDQSQCLSRFNDAEWFWSSH